MRRVLLLCGTTTTFVIIGCAKVEPREDYARASRHIEAGIGMPLPENTGRMPALAADVEALLAEGLTADEAVQIALLNNPKVRSGFASIGIARADLVQSGLFSNPTLSLAARFPDGGGLANIDAGLAQNIADLWLIPVRRKAAEADLDRQILTVARDLSGIALSTRAAYFRLVSAEREREIAQENLEVARKLVESAAGRQEAGAGNIIDVNLARAGLLDADLAWRAAALEESKVRSELAALMGLDSTLTASLSEGLPDSPSFDIAEEQIVAFAQGSRLDLLSAEREVVAAEARLEQEKRSVFSEVEVGIAMERDERRRGGNEDWFSESLAQSVEAGKPTSAVFAPQEDESQDVITGPSLSLELPIFDQNQAQIAKARYALEVAKNDRDALAIQIAQATRLAYATAKSAWEAASLYREQLLPLLQNNLDLSMEAYRAGKISFLSVLETQQQLLASRGKYVRALRDSTISVVDLERASGRPMRDLLNGALANPNETKTPVNQQNRSTVP